MSHRGNEHVVRRLSNLDRLQAIRNWLHPGSKGKAAGNIVAQKKLPECFLARELLKLTTAKRAALKIKRSDPLVMFIQHLQFTCLSGADNGLLNRNQIEVGEAAAQFLRSSGASTGTHLV